MNWTMRGIGALENDKKKINLNVIKFNGKKVNYKNVDGHCRHSL
jgi:hypothetical protein